MSSSNKSLSVHDESIIMVATKMTNEYLKVLADSLQNPNPPINSPQSSKITTTLAGTFLQRFAGLRRPHARHLNRYRVLASSYWTLRVECSHKIFSQMLIE